MKLAIGVRTVGVLVALSVAVLQPGTAQAAWNGWARCVLEIDGGTRYYSKETHTWFLDNVTATTGTGSWQVSGRGNLLTDDGVTRWQAAWAINGMKNGVKFRTTSSSGVISIRQLDSQLSQSQGIAGWSQQTISGSARDPERVASSQWEWSFPRVEGPAGSGNLTGSFTPSPNTAVGWGWNRAYMVPLVESCTWSFLDGAMPPPPPVVPPEAVPTGPPPPAAPPRLPATLTAAPLLLGLDPAAVDQGARGISVRLVAQGTHWTAGSTTADFGPDITVTAFKVRSATEAAAVLDVSPAAVPGPRAVRVITPMPSKLRPTNEVVELPGTFRVYPLLRPSGSGSGFRNPG